MTQVLQKTTLEAPDRFLTEASINSALRYRNGEWGSQDRPRPRDGVFLTPPAVDWKIPYQVIVWGDPNGHVRARAFYNQP